MDISIGIQWPGYDTKEKFDDVKSLIRWLNGFESERNSGCPNTVVLYLDGMKIATIPGMAVGKFYEFIGLIIGCAMDS
jgi:hypothetical protein